MRKDIAIVGVVLFALGALFASGDYFFKEHPHQLAMLQERAANGGEEEPTAMQQSSSSSQTGASSSASTVVRKGVSTRKKSGVDVNAVLASLQLIPQQSTEASLLELTAQGIGTQTMVLLQNNDRAALFSWIESDDVKMIFSSLKQALQEQFSPKLKELIDETKTQENGPPVDVLSFTDPAISPEKVLFLRVRNRLYEFHIVPKSEEVIEQLIAALSK